MATNPRYKNSNLRRKHRARFRAMDAPCGICKGRFGRIHYEEPSDAQHPLSFVIDEIHPVSRWKEFGLLLNLYVNFGMLSSFFTSTLSLIMNGNT